VTRRLYVVRHTSVDPVDGVPPHQWRPSADGLEAARRLARSPVWRRVELIASSTEPKALATAERIAETARVPLRPDPGLREVSREPALLEAAEHSSRVRRYLAGHRVEGWEPPDQARRRFERCVDRLVAEADGPLVVVSHATVLALYLGLTHDEWVAIPLPAVAVADPRARRLLQSFLSVDELLAGTRRLGPERHG
jgi:broad specificity phosphatase PhoE